VENLTGWGALGKLPYRILGTRPPPSSFFVYNNNIRIAKIRFDEKTVEPAGWKARLVQRLLYYWTYTKKN